MVAAEIAPTLVLQINLGEVEPAGNGERQRRRGIYRVRGIEGKVFVADRHPYGNVTARLVDDDEGSGNEARRIEALPLKHTSTPNMTAEEGPPGIA